METIETTPKVSVVLATYNRRHLLKKTIDSVLNQTFKDFEFIIVDDGSTDNTEEFIKSYDDSRIKLITTPNQGRSKARNLALNLSKGKYIAFIDSDDLFMPLKLEKQVHFLDAFEEFGMIYTAANVIDDFDKPIPVVYHAPVSGDLYYDIAFYLPVTICLPTVLIRKNILDKTGFFAEEMIRFEDTDLWRRVSKQTKIKAFPEIYTTIRTHNDNQMEDPLILFQRMTYWIKKCFKEDKKNFSRIKQRKLAARVWFHYAWAVFHHPSYSKHSVLFFQSALIYWPLNPNYFYWFLRTKFPPNERSIVFKVLGRILRKTLFKKV